MKLISELFQEHLTYGLLALACLVGACALAFVKLCPKGPASDEDPIEHFPDGAGL